MLHPADFKVTRRTEDIRSLIRDVCTGTSLKEAKVSYKTLSNREVTYIYKEFGYSDEDIEEFIKNPPDCNCSKCGDDEDEL